MHEEEENKAAVLLYVITRGELGMIVVVSFSPSQRYYALTYVCSRRGDKLVGFT